ncbi:MAG TPA: hypothetical protein VHS58_12430 [Acetobacteraceae bacterium]|nr:hypothetical protein [Acetobacteraceae bacterium]
MVLLSGFGTVAGVIVGAIAHHNATRATGWTFYSSPSPRRYADYLPQHTAWFPGIVDYAAVGLGVGALAALALIAANFRLVRARPGN